MARVKTGPVKRKRHKKILALAKGYQTVRSKLVRKASEAVIKAGSHAYAGRKQRKRQMRRLWITRLSAAVKPFDLNYSQLIKKLNDNKIELDRKILSDIAVNHPETFKEVINELK